MSSLGKFTVMFLVMIVFMEFVGVPTGASFVLSSFGININENTTDLVSGDIANSSFYNKIFGAGVGILVVLGAAGAVIIGLFAKSYDTSLVVLPWIVSLGALFGSTSWIVISYTMGLNAAWLTKIVAIVFVGLGVGFLASCVDYFRTGQ